ncbi:MAG: HyaD/HybD family hydrogenase maturation endopeptidase [Acidobacteriia bacterium]|nr:HyaD/HybD family hydrogenase maturation endopeptidase [Terriglobia bacterium]
MPTPPKYVVLGLGNTLHSDDGVGPQAVERLRSDARVPEDVALIEGGTLGLELLTYIWDCSYLLVLDAVDVGQPPGTLVRMSSQELQTLPGRGSVHQLGVADLLVALRVLARQPPTVVLLGVQPATTKWGTELSPAVGAVMGSLIEASVAELMRVAAITSA